MKWHNAVVSELSYLLLTKKIHSFVGVKVRLTLTFWHGDLVRRDSDNQLSSILDTLVDAGILEDDNWKIIPRKIINDEYDRGNPRVDIEIEELK